MSRIEWTEKTWNPIVGCSVVSPGCTNCYAMKMAARILNMNAGRALDKARSVAAGFIDYGTPEQREQYLAALRSEPSHYDGTVSTVKGKAVWSGKVALAPERVLLEPLRRKTPTMWFVNSMGDLFHEDVSDEWIDRVFAVMALCPQHTFQVLTKRSGRMRAYFTAHRRVAPLFEKHTTGPTPVQRIQALVCDFVRLGRFQPQGYGPVYAEDLAKARDRLHPLPLPNVWLGVSAEDQRRADERIPDLLSTPAAMRFVSAEPLLGPINFDAVRVTAALGFFGSALRWHHRGHCHEQEGIPYPTLDWVIVGGESGPNARPMHPDWVRSIRDQCKAADVPFFFKQWGEWEIASQSNGYIGGVMPETGERFRWIGKSGQSYVFRAPENDDCYAVSKVGKKRAGRLLDGREWNEMPAYASAQREQVLA